jgi:TPR repeat protein
LADQGNPDGQFKFAICLEDGRGISIALLEAARYYKLYGVNIQKDKSASNF